jgi:hypothetical protein
MQSAQNSHAQGMRFQQDSIAAVYLRAQSLCRNQDVVQAGST